MSPIDVVTVAVFAAAVLLALAAVVLLDWRRQRPRYRMRERLQIATGGASRSPGRQKILAELRRAQTEARRRRRRETLGSLGYYLNRLDTVAGQGGARHLALVAAAVSIIGIALLLLEFIPFSIWIAFGVVVVAPLAVAWIGYGWLVARFNKRFLQQMPEAMDMIVRASQAGIPVTQSIRNVGLQFLVPLGPEFRRMGDNLLLGNDLEDVLDDAALRIEMPDFSFFTVCVLLQRESGGSIVEALENLSGIIRARRDLLLKARALTAEGRMAGLILSLLPFIVVGLMYSVNQAYIEVLFTTESGRKILWTAIVMLVLGVAMIRRISNMRV